MSGRWALAGVVLMGVVTALWVGFTAWYAIVLITQPEPVGRAIGVALLVLPLIAVWWLVVETRFVLGGQRLIRELAHAGELPADELPRLPSGRIDPVAGREELPRWQAEAAAAPDDWRAGVRLSLAYDAAGDRPHARAQLRRAIAQRRAEARAARDGRRGAGDGGVG